MTVHNVHDSGYKKVFANHTFFRQLLETFVKEPWVADLDFSEAETLDKSFIADHYKATESDLIYKVKLRGEAVYIYLLHNYPIWSRANRHWATMVSTVVTSRLLKTSLVANACWRFAIWFQLCF